MNRFSKLPSEEDTPFPNTEVTEIVMPDSDVRKLEGMADLATRVQKLTLRNRAFWLIVLFVLIIIILYGTDVILINIGLTNSELSNGVFEFFKISASTLLGFVFSNEIMRDKK